MIEDNPLHARHALRLVVRDRLVAIDGLDLVFFSEAEQLDARSDSAAPDLPCAIVWIPFEPSSGSKRNDAGGRDILREPELRITVIAESLDYLERLTPQVENAIDDEPRLGQALAYVATSFDESPPDADRAWISARLTYSLTYETVEGAPETSLQPFA